MSCSTSNIPISPVNPPELIIAGHLFFGSGVFPDDFTERLDRLRRATGLTWAGFADVRGRGP